MKIIRRFRCTFMHFRNTFFIFKILFVIMEFIEKYVFSNHLHNSTHFHDIVFAELIFNLEKLSSKLSNLNLITFKFISTLSLFAMRFEFHQRFPNFRIRLFQVQTSHNSNALVIGMNNFESFNIHLNKSYILLIF